MCVGDLLVECRRREQRDGSVQGEYEDKERKKSGLRRRRRRRRN